MFDRGIIDFFDNLVFSSVNSVLFTYLYENDFVLVITHEYCCQLFYTFGLSIDAYNDWGRWETDIRIFIAF